MFTRDWHGRILIREKVIQPLHKVQVVAEMSCERVGQVGDQSSGYLETIVQVIIPVRAHLELYECWMNLHGQQRCVWWAYPSKSSHHRHQVVIVFLLWLGPRQTGNNFSSTGQNNNKLLRSSLGSVAGSFQYRSDAFLVSRFYYLESSSASR